MMIVTPRTDSDAKLNAVFAGAWAHFEARRRRAGRWRRRDVSRSLQLAFLAPDLVEAILDDTQPIALTAERLKRAGELPLLWDEQRARLS